MSHSEKIPRQTLRIIDASLNRVGEGLRLLEEIARLQLNDAPLTRQLKTMRHEMVRSALSFQRQLLQSRDAEGDVGVDMAVPGEEKDRELPLVLVANARRVQESLRTLEELAKIPAVAAELDSEKFQQARFALYTVEQKLLSRLLRQDKLENLSGLYAIIDTEALKGRSHIEVASQIIRGGARTIQLRDKVRGKKEILPVARQLKNLCAGSNVLFLINDYLDVALDADADGVHLGQDDMPVSAARRILPLDKIIGCSTTSVDQALAAQAEGADYIAVGAMYPTVSKTSTRVPARVIGLDTLRQVRQAVPLPLVAIGGITKDNASEVVAAGADAVAIINALINAASPEEAARQIVAGLERQK